MTPRLFIANQKLPLETGLEKQQRWQQCLPVAQHSWPSMKICELYCIIWALTPGYPILITWKNCIHPGEMYWPQGVYAWDYLPVLRKGRAARHRDGQCALQGNPAQAVRSPAQPFPHPRQQALLSQNWEKLVRKKLQGAETASIPFINLLDGLVVFLFKLSIHLTSYFFLCCFFPLFILFSLTFLY